GPAGCQSRRDHHPTGGNTTLCPDHPDRWTGAAPLSGGAVGRRADQRAVGDTAAEISGTDGNTGISPLYAVAAGGDGRHRAAAGMAARWQSDGTASDRLRLADTAQGGNYLQSAHHRSAYEPAYAF